MPLQARFPDLVPERYKAPFVAAVTEVEELRPPAVDFVDGFCGHGELGVALNARSDTVCLGFDAFTGANSITQSLSKYWADLVIPWLCVIAARCKQRAVWFFGPPCCSWVWFSRKVTKRSSTNIFGDTENMLVAEGNDIAGMLAELLWFLRGLDLKFVIEQPTSSLLWSFPPMAAVLSYGGLIAVSIQQGRFGAASVKPTSLRGTWQGIQQIRNANNRRILPQNLRPLTQVVGRWVHSTPGMRRSAAYTPEFAQAIARIYWALDWRAAVTLPRIEPSKWLYRGRFTPPAGIHRRAPDALAPGSRRGPAPEEPKDTEDSDVMVEDRSEWAIFDPYLDFETETSSSAASSCEDHPKAATFPVALRDRGTKRKLDLDDE